MSSYLVIGNRWGNVINTILNNLYKKSKIIRVNYTNANRKDYLKLIDQIISNSDAKTVWLAVPPHDYLDISRIIIKYQKNIIYEKPWIFNNKETQELIELFKINKLFNAVNFEFLYLNALKKIDINNLNNINYDFHSINKTKYKISSKLELGSHLAAIHYAKFREITDYKMRTSYNKKNLRKISFNFKEKEEFVIDFTSNTEPLIQRLIIDFEQSLNNCQNFKYDINFASNVYSLHLT